MQLEGLSDLDALQSQLSPEGEAMSPSNASVQYRRGTMQSNMSAVGKE